jgi:hypothetical protein
MTHRRVGIETESSARLQDQQSGRCSGGMNKLPAIHSLLLFHFLSWNFY